MRGTLKVTDRDVHCALGLDPDQGIAGMTAFPFSLPVRGFAVNNFQAKAARNLSADTMRTPPAILSTPGLRRS